MEKSFIEYLNELNANNEEQQKNTEKDRENEIKQAKRERAAALFGDISKLLLQSYAKAGGAWKIPTFKPFTQQSNNYIKKLRKEHQEQRIKELNRQKEQNLNTAKYLYNTEIRNNQFEQRQQQQQNQFEQRQQQQQNQFEQSQQQQQNQFEQRQQQQQNQFEQRHNANKSAYDTYYLYNEETQSYNPYSNIHAAYNSLPTGYKAVIIRIDNTGRQLIIEDPHPTLQKMQQMINIYNYTKENGIAYDSFNTIPFNIQSGYHTIEDDDLQDPIYNPDGTITFRKVSDQPIRRR